MVAGVSGYKVYVYQDKKVVFDVIHREKTWAPIALEQLAPACAWFMHMSTVHSCSLTPQAPVQTGWLPSWVSFIGMHPLSRIGDTLGYLGLKQTFKQSLSKSLKSVDTLTQISSCMSLVRWWIPCSSGKPGTSAPRTCPISLYTNLYIPGFALAVGLSSNGQLSGHSHPEFLPHYMLLQPLLVPFLPPRFLITPNWVWSSGSHYRDWRTQHPPIPESSPSAI